MIDIKFFRKNIQIIAARLATRNFQLNVAVFTELENKRKQIQNYTEKLQYERNNLSKHIGILKFKNADTSAMMIKVANINQELQDSEINLKIILTKIKDFLSNIPNLPHISTPIGNNENFNVELRQVGVPPSFNFCIKDHVDIGMTIGLNFDTAIKIAGSRFVLMKGNIARLHRALGQFMLDVHTLEHGYTECNVPYIVNIKSLYGTGQLPKFATDLFRIKNNKQENNISDNNTILYLIPTAEVPLINIVRDEIFSDKTLPLKFVAHSPCFRSEVGNYGRDIRGMIRQHQFDKVEIVQIVHPNKSYEVLEEMLNHAEVILKKLNLHYRIVSLCSGNIGFSAAKTYDIEVWLPAQKIFREISSISNCEAFQARRIQARFRDKYNTKIHLVHTLNGSGLAVGRTLVAILENFQQSDGSVIIPEVLRCYMGGLEKIFPEYTIDKMTHN